MGKLRNDEKLRHLYMSYIDDGILDLFAGMLALFAGILFFSDMFWMAGVYVAIFLPVVWSFKEKVTMPRVRPEELNAVMARKSYYAFRRFLIGRTFPPGPSHSGRHPLTTRRSHAADAQLYLRRHVGPDRGELSWAASCWSAIFTGRRAGTPMPPWLFF